MFRKGLRDSGAATKGGGGNFGFGFEMVMVLDWFRGILKSLFDELAIVAF